MPPGHRFACLWSPPYSPSQGSSRGREESGNVGESDLKPNQRTPVRRAPPTPSLQQGALWPPDFKAQSAPFLSHTLLCTHTLSLSLSLSLLDPLGYGQVEKTLDLLVCTSILSVDKPQPPLTDSQGYRHLQPAAISYLCVNRSNSSTLGKAATFLQTYRPVVRGNLRPLWCRLWCFLGHDMAFIPM